jgi:hypothetical protein
MMHNASKTTDYSLTMSIIRVKQFVNAAIYPIFGFSECISLLMHAAASCCTPISAKKHQFICENDRE